ncbi:hypothetical protein PsorP6_010184 [Peronosclerospora sorghi]|uniref:Uncharacterized protein n=1 Tax=Peronosclerospora sorghi TaxID=230839 RepID=A0ACC0VW61_9STRA|nr:hypothetical protein PsorP6_018861 [Peronosclerospora sorghi]KAI9905113.1 hypothetical protein PsorP6_018508 [Peronosclerospora sorghi]KAI9910605.1 hypothetical protein PsorP6_010184 [Peronosclerospora sorghi]
MNQHLLWYLGERAFWHFNFAFGSSRIARRAYPVWPTSNLIFTSVSSIKKPTGLTDLKFENSCCYPEGNFGGNQLLDGSISLSPLYPSLTIDLHFTIFRVPTYVLKLKSFTTKDHDRSITEVRNVSYLRQLALTFTFISRWGFDTLTLAHMLDSLVRVSRRVGSLHFVNVPNGNKLKSASIHTQPHAHSKLSAHGVHGDADPLKSTL